MTNWDKMVIVIYLAYKVILHEKIAVLTLGKFETEMEIARNFKSTVLQLQKFIAYIAF